MTNQAGFVVSLTLASHCPSSSATASIDSVVGEAICEAKFRADILVYLLCTIECSKGVIAALEPHIGANSA